jgi:hypothetical protein
VQDVSERSTYQVLTPFDPERLIAVLAAHHVQFVLIGALGARMQGFPRLTADADITPARDEKNLGHLASALRELNARVYTESVPEGLAFDFTARSLARADMWNLVTAAGRLDIAFVPSGTTGYDDLSQGALTYEVNGSTFKVARLEDIIRSKKAADRPQDRQDVALMLELIERRDAG